LAVGTKSDELEAEERDELRVLFGCLAEVTKTVLPGDPAFQVIRLGLGVVDGVKKLTGEERPLLVVFGSVSSGLRVRRV
jgi:hypothetical protein